MALGVTNDHFGSHSGVPFLYFYSHSSVPKMKTLVPMKTLGFA